MTDKRRENPLAPINASEWFVQRLNIEMVEHGIRNESVNDSFNPGQVAGEKHFFPVDEHSGVISVRLSKKQFMRHLSKEGRTVPNETCDAARRKIEKCVSRLKRTILIN